MALASFKNTILHGKNGILGDITQRRTRKNESESNA